MSKEIILDTNQMAFLLYNMFGHDIAHDAHPATLGDGRFSKAIRQTAQRYQEHMSTSHGGRGSHVGGYKKIKRGGNPDDELVYFQSIGQMTSRNTLITSIGSDLIDNGMLYSANLPRTSVGDDVRMWQDINLILIDVPKIRQQFSTTATTTNTTKELYPGFIYFNGEVFDPYDAVVYSQPAPQGLDGIQIIVSLKNFVVTIPVPDNGSIYIQEINNPRFVTYYQITRTNFNSMINILGNDFFYTSFNDYMKTTSFLKLKDAPNVYFVSYILKTQGPDDSSQNFFNKLIQFYTNILKNRTDNILQNIKLVFTFLEVLYAFNFFKTNYDKKYIDYCRNNFNFVPQNLSLNILVQIFLGQIQQIKIENNNKKYIYPMIDLFGDTSTEDKYIINKMISLINNNKSKPKIIQEIKRNEKSTNPKYSSKMIQTFLDIVNSVTIPSKTEKEISLLKDFFIITKMCSTINYIDDYVDENDNIIVGGALKQLNYEGFIIPHEFINHISEGLPEQIKNNASLDKIILDPENNVISNGYIHSKIQVSDYGIKTLLPRDSLPEVYAQALYGASTSTTIKENALLTFLIKVFPSNSDIEALSSLDEYKNKLYNDPTISKTSTFVEDLNNIFKNKEEHEDLNTIILTLLIDYGKPEFNFDNFLKPLFVFNAKGVIPKEYVKSIGVLAAFEQSVIRQIRIAILYSLLSKIPNSGIPVQANIVNRFMTNLSESLSIYLNIIAIITKIFESVPGLTTIQKMNSSYLISISILAIKQAMSKITTGNNYILNAQINILSSIYLKKNIVSGKTGKGDIDNKLLTAFKEWITTGSKGAGNFEGNAGFVENENNLTTGILESLGLQQTPNSTELYFINNAVTAKVGIPPFFCPISSIMDGQRTCYSWNSALQNNGIEYGTIDVIIRDGNITNNASQRTGETMRYHIRVETNPQTKRVRISAFLKIGDEILINIGRLSSTPGLPEQPDPYIEIDLNSDNSPLKATECLKEIIMMNIDTLTDSSGRNVKSWDEYLNLITSDTTLSTNSGNTISTQMLRRKIISTSFRKSIGDVIQELNMVVENGGYIDGGPVLMSKPGTRILSPNVFRLGLSNDRPSGVRILLLLLFGKKDVNQNSIGGFINPTGKYLLAMRNKKMRGGGVGCVGGGGGYNKQTQSILKRNNKKRKNRTRKVQK